MDYKPFIVLALINSSCFTETLINTRCLSYGLCDPSFAQKNAFTYVQIEPQTVLGVDSCVIAKINEVIVVYLDLDGYKEERVFLYMAPISYYDMILGMLWITAQDVQINRPWLELQIGGLVGALIQSKNEFLQVERSIPKAVMVSATLVQWLQLRG